MIDKGMYIVGHLTLDTIHCVKGFPACELRSLRGPAGQKYIKEREILPTNVGVIEGGGGWLRKCANAG